VLVAFRELLGERRETGTAVGAFTCYDVTTALGVVRAAEERGVPVILLVAEASFREPDGRRLLAALTAVAHQAPVQACVQLDHVADLELTSAAISAGVGAVLADGSTLPSRENADFVRRVRAAAAPLGVGVEAELGHIEGGEDVAAATAAGALTDPEEAAAFVAETAIDCLAVSIGNVHGTYAAPPRLDWELLQHIGERVGDVPLSLHGASGLTDEDVRRAISLGICKVNVNTELRARYVDELEAHLPSVRPGLRLLELQRALAAAVAGAAGAKLDLLAGR
jgi:tagatose 1,6-diphosphate aldolase GatY/KbaY